MRPSTTTTLGVPWRMLLLPLSLIAVVVPPREALGGGSHPSSACMASAFASPSIPPPPPVSVPVWSLAAPLTPTSLADADLTSERRTSMSIVTFATPVSVAPPKLWVVSLYDTSQTRAAFVESGVGVMQLLTPDQDCLVPILGKRSGYEREFSKRDACAGLMHGWIAAATAELGEKSREKQEGVVGPSPLCSADDDGGVWSNLDLLPRCATYVKLRLRSLTDAGDHDVALCEVVGTGRWDESTRRVVANTEGETAPSALDPSTALYTAQLRSSGII